MKIIKNLFLVLLSALPLISISNAEIGEIKKSDNPNREYMRCKVMKGIVQSDDITNIDLCNNGIDGCDKNEKDWKTQRMYCVNSSKYECYKKDLWIKEDPTMIGFEKREYPYISKKTKKIDGIMHTEICVYW